MRVLLLGDASHYHATLAAALRRLGHDVTLASDAGGWMRTPCDIALRRPLPGKAGGALLYARMLADKRLTRGYDVVQLVNPAFVQLLPCRLSRLFKRLRQNNGSVWLTALGTDTAYMEICLDPEGPLPYSEWMVDGQPTEHHLAHSRTANDWLTEPLRGLCREVYDGVDGIVTALYEYHLSALRHAPAYKVHYGGIPIEMSETDPIVKQHEGPLKLLLGRHSYRQTEKGTDMLERAARAAIALHPGCAVLDIVEDLPYDEYVRHYDDADIVLDQVYSLTPATNALMAMARGKAVVSGGEDAYYRFIGENQPGPIVNAPPRLPELTQVMTRLVTDPSCVLRLRREGPAFVRRNNEASVVARRFIKAWES